MAVTESEEARVGMPDAGPMLRRASAPWLRPMRERVAGMQDLGRMPHGLLLTGPPGAGQAELGAWMAARALCRSPGADACGQCADCRLILAGNHPDLLWLGVEPEKKEISIEQVRALSRSLSLRSYRGGAKFAVIAPAEAMNIKSFNALLKTLEEPSVDSYLALATSRVDRMPRTIVSRCLRLALPVPTESEGSKWLAGVASRDDWRALLALANGAPFLAEDYALEGLGDLDREMRSLVADAGAGRLDVMGSADTCAREAPAARLAWLESWLTRSLKAAFLASDLVNDNRLPWLQAPGLEMKIRAGFGLLDQLRDARRLVGSALNTQLLFEGILLSLAALVGGQAGMKEEGTG